MTATVPVEPMEALADAVLGDDVRRAAELLTRHPELRDGLNGPMPRGAFGAPILSAAVSRKNREMIDLLLQHGADINGRSDWWAGSFGVLDGCDPELAPFLISRGAIVDANAAARLGMFDELKRLVSAKPELVHARGGDGQTPLHVARTVEIAEYLIEHGADINARDVDHESTPAQYLVRDRPEIARLLVRRGCHTDILMAAALGELDLVRRFLDDAPSSVRTTVSNEYFPMRDRRAGGTIYIWTLGGGKSAHAIAREFGQDDVFALLMDRSPDALKLTRACELGDETLVKALLSSQPTLARTLSADDQCRLVDAAERDNADAVRLMLGSGWPPDVRGNHGATALHFASWMGNLEIVRELLRHGAALELRSEEFDLSPLGWALHGSEHSWRKNAGDYVGVVKALLAAGAKAPAFTSDLRASEPVLAVLRDLSS